MSETERFESVCAMAVKNLFLRADDIGHSVSLLFQAPDGQFDLVAKRLSVERNDIIGYSIPE